MNGFARLSAAASLAFAAPILAVTPAEAVDAAAAAKPRLPKGTITARVIKIVSGDTLDVRHQGKIRRVRLLAVATPKRGQCWSREATARTTALLKTGKGVYLLRDRRLKDTQGRYLYYAWTPSGTFVNRNLIRYGFGRVVPVKPNDRYLRVMRADQAKAKKERLRIWSGKCGPLGRGTAAGAAGSAGGTGGSGSGGRSGGGNKGTSGGGTDPRFRTCGEANAAGYGPYHRGRDPEYSWYQDRDGDGVVCER